MWLVHDHGFYGRGPKRHRFSRSWRHETSVERDCGVGRKPLSGRDELRLEPIPHQSFQVCRGIAVDAMESQRVIGVISHDRGNHTRPTLLASLVATCRIAGMLWRCASSQCAMIVAEGTSRATSEQKIRWHSQLATHTHTHTHTERERERERERARQTPTESVCRHSQPSPLVPDRSQDNVSELDNGARSGQRGVGREHLYPHLRGALHPHRHLVSVGMPAHARIRV